VSPPVERPPGFARGARRLDELCRGHSRTFARLESRSLLRCVPERLLELGEVVLPRLVFVVATRELTDFGASGGDLVLEARGRGRGARKLLLRLDECRLLARLALGGDLALELGQACAQRDRLRLLGQVVLREPALHIAQVLARLRRTLLEVRERRVIARPCDGVACRRGLRECPQLAFGRRHLLVGQAEGRAQVAHLREDLVLPALERNDVMANTEGFQVPSLGHHGGFQPLHLLVGLGHRFARRILVRLGQPIAIDIDRRIDEWGKNLGIRSFADQLDDIGLGHRERLELRLHPGNRIGAE
jgi:hypothetical protein